MEIRSNIDDIIGGGKKRYGGSCWEVRGSNQTDRVGESCLCVRTERRPLVTMRLSWTTGAKTLQTVNPLRSHHDFTPHTNNEQRNIKPG